MKAEMTRIGNPEVSAFPSLIEQCGLGDIIELSVEDNRLVISGQRRPRLMGMRLSRIAHPKANDELLLESLAPSKFDLDEWQW